MHPVRRAKISIVNLEVVEILVGYNKFTEAVYPTMVQDLGNIYFFDFPMLDHSLIVKKVETNSLQFTH